jgi:hypothetical protein
LIFRHHLPRKEHPAVATMISEIYDAFGAAGAPGDVTFSQVIDR